MGKKDKQIKELREIKIKPIKTGFVVTEEVYDTKANYRHTYEHAVGNPSAVVGKIMAILTEYN